MTTGGAITIQGKYPDDWPAIAAAVKDAAGWRCVRCGHLHESPALRMLCDKMCDPARHGRGQLNDGKRRVLTVHHLDGNKSNCLWFNLLALCQVCHLHIQAKVNPDRPWLLVEHSEWFKVYAAGFYGYKYLRQVYSRRHVEQNLDDLLALETIGGTA